MMEEEKKRRKSITIKSFIYHERELEEKKIAILKH